MFGCAFIAWVTQVPTTLMAVVDAAVGIKTAVNFHNKKNKLGTYQPPLGVLYDTAFLKTLDTRHISNGAAEVFKMACIKDCTLFELLEEHGKDLIGDSFQVTTNTSMHVVASCCTSNRSQQHT